MFQNMKHTLLITSPIDIAQCRNQDLHLQDPLSLSSGVFSASRKNTQQVLLLCNMHPIVYFDSQKHYVVLLLRKMHHIVYFKSQKLYAVLLRINSPAS